MVNAGGPSDQPERAAIGRIEAWLAELQQEARGAALTFPHRRQSASNSRRSRTGSSSSSASWLPRSSGASCGDR